MTLKKIRHKDFTTFLVIALSAMLSALAIQIFVYSGNFFPGGFSGISVLLNRIGLRYFNLNIPYGVWYGLLNIPPTLLVFKVIGKRFTLFSILHYALVVTFTFIIPPIKVQMDIILLAIFGGILAGTGSVLALMRDASGGGTDFIAIYVSHKYRRPVFQNILYANMGILLIAGLLFGWEEALYSIIYQFVVTQVIESRYTRYKLMSLNMITEIPDVVTASILNTTRHGITKIWGEGGYSGKKKCLLYMVVNAFEVNAVLQAAKQADPKIFISISKTEKIVGNYFMKPLE
jgi:uncharacterized membrane-anchored protein YitT (DUF2179 family)